MAKTDHLTPKNHTHSPAIKKNCRGRDGIMILLVWIIMVASKHVHGFALRPALLPAHHGIRSSGRVHPTAFALGLSLGSHDDDAPGDVNFARRVAEAVHPSVALVTPEGVRNMTARGSGFLIDYDDDTDNSIYLLTAAHVAIPGYGLKVQFPDLQESFPATVVDRHVPSDLALIRIDDADNTLKSRIPLNIVQENVIPVGTLAFANGFPGGITGSNPAMTMGIVCGQAAGFGQDFFYNRNTTLEQNHANTTFVVTDAAMAGGMSGGPLVDASGNVLGMNALVRPDMRALGNYAVSSRTCREFVEAARSKHDGANNAAPSTNGYRVVLYNDPMNKRERVSRILREVAELDETTANNVMMSAHTTGRGIVKEFTVECRSEADDFCTSLRNQDVLVEVEAMN